MPSKLNIGIFGLGYVGLSNAILFSKNANVSAYDLDKKKVQDLNKNLSPIKDKDIEKYLRDNKNKIKFEVNSLKSFKEKDYIFICVPTDFSDNKNEFDTSKVSSLINQILKLNKKTIIVIRSTVPIGFTERINKKYKTNKIIFIPEFLREGSALKDNFYPSRIILGGKKQVTKAVGELIAKCTKKKKIKKIYMSDTEAEATKLFSNTYLAMRVAFFNELDTFSYSNNLNTKSIIKGVSADNRIGDYYNNPSFGYGGYCLPKDTKQLLKNFDIVPQKIIRSIILSNNERKKFIYKIIKKQKPDIIGIYRIAMKSNSDNFRDSSIIGIIDLLINDNAKVIIYEPLLKTKSFRNCHVEQNLQTFKKSASVIISNRLDDDLHDVVKKVFTRDIFHEN